MQNRDMDIKGREVERERSLLNFRILDTEPEEAFDELARLAAFVCKTPIALITFIDKDREWIKSAVGIDIDKREIPLQSSFGARLISDPEEFLAVFNPTSDDILGMNPLIRSIKDIGFCAGVPLTDLYESKIGSLTVLGYKPKDLSFEQLSLLKTIAKQVMVQLEQRKARTDHTGPVIDFKKLDDISKSQDTQDHNYNKVLFSALQDMTTDTVRTVTKKDSGNEGIQITSLGEKEISDWVYKLEAQSKQLILLCEMDELLQAANSDQDIYTIIKNYVKKLFPNTKGALYVLNDALNLIQDVVTWGHDVRSEHSFTPEMCWGLRLGRIHTGTSSSKELYCQHIVAGNTFNYLCAPLSAGSKALGLIYIQDSEEPSYDLDYERLGSSDKQYILSTIAKHSGLALANLKHREHLGAQAVYDSLTGLFNRRYMEETLKRELSRVTRKKNPLGLIMADIDHFKRFNDSYGHAAGDVLLRSLGSFFKEHVRREDIACRYGGEEFVLIMPESSLENTRMRAEQIREEIKQLRIWHHGSLIDSVNVSMGVVVFSEHGNSAETLLESADKALYKAKRQGRDRIETA
jgi:diguanylate cyclase (GGDEF)-like protein